MHSIKIPIAIPTRQAIHASCLAIAVTLDGTMSIPLPMVKKTVKVVSCRADMLDWLYLFIYFTSETGLAQYVPTDD
ncbi:hypothetical protein GCM10008933_40440 [Paenibacillus motobuensis]|uniref:Uncharacterized protein n=1 Tax=Paenibacillus motobuensis TaxID=295324 RepID=A0ABN0YQS2_9BACL